MAETAPQALQFSVVIPAYGESPWLADCLDHLMRQTRPANEIIVFHTGDHDPTPRLGPAFPEVRIVHQDAREYAGGARNRGAALASSDWLVFLDCDMMAAPDWLAAVECAAVISKNRVLVGSIGCAKPGGIWRHAMWFLECGVVLPHRRPRQLDAANGANFAVPAEIFSKSCQFRYDLANGEDVDLMCQLRKSGVSICFEPSMRADHVFDGTTSHTIRRAFALGKAAASVRRHEDLPGAAAVRHPILALGLPVARLGQMSKRIFQENGPIGRFLLDLPLTATLASVWSAGFFMEALRGGRGAPATA